MTRPARRAVFVDQVDRFFDQTFGQLLRITNRGGGQDELRPRTVELRHPLQSAKHIGDVRAKDAAVGMGLVDDHIFQAAEEIEPVGVMRQDPGVQHIRVGEHDAGVFADGRAVLLRSVAVIDGSGQCPVFREQWAQN